MMTPERYGAAWESRLNSPIRADRLEFVRNQSGFDWSRKKRFLIYADRPWASAAGRLLEPHGQRR
jgi:hypothetical protein